MKMENAEGLRCIFLIKVNKYKSPAEKKLFIQAEHGSCLLSWAGQGLENYF